MCFLAEFLPSIFFSVILSSFFICFSTFPLLPFTIKQLSKLNKYQVLEVDRKQMKTLYGYDFSFSSFFFFFFCLFRVAMRHMEAKGQMGATAASLYHSHSKFRTRATSATYTTAHGTAGSLTHWARTGIEPVPAWMLIRFINCWAMTGTPGCDFFF